jgi:phosphopantothenoylcysteine decarboxylase/phosphopantothenate--cysteine ligase
VTGLGGRRVLLGVSGGIAAYKAASLARALQESGADVTAVLTASASRFVGADTFSGLTGRAAHTSVWERPGTVLHVELAHQTDVLVIAPATANTIAKLTHGLADDLLSATALEYRGPMVLAPAMHAGMWEAPATVANVRQLRGRGVRFVGPVDGPLAHGDEGIGRMSEPSDIVSAVIALLGATDGALAGCRVLITAGPTHEPIDAVRFLGNRSSGRLGVALAERAAARGWTTTLLLGPSSLVPSDSRVKVYRFRTTADLDALLKAHLPAADVLVMAAAVADFRPRTTPDALQGKIRRTEQKLTLELEPTPDLLATHARGKLARQVFVGFALEPRDELRQSALSKLERKRLDLVVANPLETMDSETIEATVIFADRSERPTEGVISKGAFAEWLLDLIDEVRAGRRRAGLSL